MHLQISLLSIQTTTVHIQANYNLGTQTEQFPSNAKKHAKSLAAKSQQKRRTCNNYKLIIVLRNNGDKVRQLHWLLTVG